MPEILLNLQSMDDVEELIAYMDRFFSKIDRREPEHICEGEQQHIRPSTSVDAFINSGGDLMKKFTKRLNWHVFKTCLLSALDSRTTKLVVDVLSQAQPIPCVGMGLSIIVYLLEQSQQVYGNNEHIIHLLRSMYDLSKHMKNLDIHLPRPKLDEILCIIVKGTLMCALEMKSNNLCRFISTPLDEADLSNRQSQLADSYQNLLLLTETVVSERLPILPPPSHGKYPHNAVGIEEAQNNVVQLLDFTESSCRDVELWSFMTSVVSERRL